MKTKISALPVDIVLAAVVIIVFFLTQSSEFGQSITKEPRFAILGTLAVVITILRWISQGHSLWLPSLMLVFSIYVMATNSRDMEALIIFGLNFLIDLALVIDNFMPVKTKLS